MTTILTVCDANVCRSVAAEFLLATELAQHSAVAGVTVSSRGAQALTAHSACRLVVELHDDRGWLDRARAHQSAQLDGQAIEDADLILTATTGSRSAVVAMLPKARRKVFTLREAQWLAAGYQPTPGVTGEVLVRDFVQYIDAQRGLRQAPRRRGRLWHRGDHPLDIADNHGSGRRAHAATLAAVQAVVSDLVRSLSQGASLPFLSTKEPAVE